jgi:hypothetical protein
MANQVSEQCYEKMISELYSFANNVYNSASEMQTLASVCAQALNEEDPAVQQIYAKIKGCEEKYANATGLAKNIASAMQAELDYMRKEREGWNSND